MRVGIEGFEPFRLTQIRQSRGFTKINLGRMLGRSPSTITKWENGSHSPDAGTLNNLSQVLNCPPAWFTKPRQKMTVNSPVFFRTLSKTAKDLCDASEIYMDWLQEISWHLQEYLNYHEVDFPHLDVKDYRAIDDETIEKMASECRK